MRSAVSTILVVLFLTAVVPPSAAQDKPVELSGAASAGYTSTQTEVGAPIGSPDGTPGAIGESREIDLGLDLHFGTYVYSPRFIEVSTDFRFSTLKGKIDDEDNDRGVVGQTYAINVLRYSSIPFRFLYSKEDSEYSYQRDANFTSDTRTLRWDWMLRRRDLPEVGVMYDSRTDEYGVFDNPTQVTHTKGLTVTARDNVFGFATSGSYNRRSSEYEVTDLNTLLNRFRFDAIKSFGPASQLSVRATYETTDFDPAPGIADQRFSYLDVRTEYYKRFNDRFFARAYHQFDSNSVVTAVEEIPLERIPAASGLFAPTPAAYKLDPSKSVFAEDAEIDLGLLPGLAASQLAAGVSRASAAVTASPTGLFKADRDQADQIGIEPGVPTIEISTTSSIFGGQASYALFPTLTFTAGSSVSFIEPPEGPFEAVTRLVDLQGTVAWGQRLGFFSARANATYGVSLATSNVDTSNNAPYYSGSAGFTVGSGAPWLFFAEANYSRHEEVFLLGGFATDVSANAGFETQILPSFFLRASAGLSWIDELTPQGREEYSRAQFSATLDNRYVTFQYSYNTTEGNRDIYSTPFEPPLNRLFYSLPTDLLIPDPLQNTRALFSQAVIRARLVRNLDLEARYTRNESEYVRAADSETRQFEALAMYTLGKFTFRAGVRFQDIMVEGTPDRQRNQYYFRVIRTFRIF